MKNFSKVIREINKTLNFFNVFETLLNTAVFFLLIYFLLSLINLFPILAAIPAAAYFFARTYSASRLDKRRIVEDKYEPLKEKLRTAADNMNNENQVVDELQQEVVHDLRHVNLSSFINTRKISYKIFLTIVLSFAIVFATTTNLYIVDLNQFLTELPDKIQSSRLLGNNNPIGEVNESEDIYGESQLATLGNNQVDIKIQPASYEVSVRETGDAEQKQFDEIFPDEVSIEQSSASKEHVPEEQQELVKNYFDQLTG